MRNSEENKTAVIYARYSSERQNEQSIEGQIRIIKSFAEREGYNIIDSYIDKAITGRTDDRPSFQQMIEASKNHAFKYVLVYKLDRFSRSRYDSAIYKKILSDNGVKVISATENIGENPEGIILEAILEGYSEYYSKELAQKIVRGNYDSRSKGLFTGGRVIYGYRIIDRKYVVEENEAEIVKRIFDEVINKKKLVDIAKELNDSGIPYVNGEKWDDKRLSRLLRNEKYVGIARFHDSVFDNIVPRIVEDNVFKEASKILDRNKHKSKVKENYKFLLSGKIYCGDCEAPMYGHSGTSRTGKVYLYYKCSNAVNTHSCSMKAAKKEFVEDFVVNYAIEYLLSPENLSKLANDMVDYYNSFIDDDVQIKILSDALKETETRLNNSLKAIQMGIINKSVADMISSLEKDKETMENELLRLKSKAKVKITFDQCYQFLLSMAYLDTKREENRELIIKRLVKKVIVYENKIGVIFYPCNDSGVKSNNSDNFGGNGSDNGENTGNSSDSGGSSPITFGPPKRFLSEPVYVNCNGYMGIVLKWRP